METIDDILCKSFGLHTSLPYMILSKCLVQSKGIVSKSNATLETYKPTEPVPFEAGRISDTIASRSVEKSEVRKEKKELADQEEKMKSEQALQRRVGNTLNMIASTK